MHELSKEILGVLYDDPKMSAADLDRIEILDKQECSDLWCIYVSVACQSLDYIIKT